MADHIYTVPWHHCSICGISRKDAASEIDFAKCHGVDWKLRRSFGDSQAMFIGGFKHGEIETFFKTMDEHYYLCYASCRTLTLNTKHFHYVLQKINNHATKLTKSFYLIDTMDIFEALALFIGPNQPFIFGEPVQNRQGSFFEEDH